jgi:hypothetical protein
MTPLETTTRILRIDRRNIAFLKFVLEAYEGIAVLTTLERDPGTVRLAIAPGCEGEVAAVLNDLSPTIRMEPRETPADAHGSVERSFAQPKRTR